MSTVQALLAQWGVQTYGTNISAPQNFALRLQKFSLVQAQNWFTISPGFTDDAEIWLDPRRFSSGVKTSLTAVTSPRAKSGLKLAILAPAPGLQLFIGGEDCRVAIGAVPHFAMHAMVWAGSSLVIGDGATCNGARAVLQRSSLIIGHDAMLSDDILLQTSHQHTLVDLATKTALTRADEAMVIGEHVWLGRRAMVMPGVRIGTGAVLAAGAVAARDIPACTVAAGVPAAVIRENVSWCRNYSNEVDEAELTAAGILPVP